MTAWLVALGAVGFGFAAGSYFSALGFADLPDQLVGVGQRRSNAEMAIREPIVRRIRHTSTLLIVGLTHLLGPALSRSRGRKPGCPSRSLCP